MRPQKSLRETSRLWAAARRRIEWFVLPPFLIAAFMVGYVVESDRSNLTEITARAKATEDAQLIAWQLEKSVLEPVYLTKSLASLAKIDIEKFERSFTDIAKELRNGNPDIINIALAPNLVVSQVHPLEGNQMVLGLDFRIRPKMLSGIQRAFAEDQIFLSGPIISVQGPEVFIVRAPITLEDSSRTTQEWGVVSVVFLASKVTENLPYISELSGYSLAIQGLDQSLPNEGFFFGNKEDVSNDTIWQKVSVPGGEWNIALTPKTGWSTSPMGQSNTFRGLYTLAIAIGALSIFMLARLWRQRSEAECLLNSAINSIDQGFVVFDETDRLLIHNQAFLDYHPLCQDILQPGVEFSELLKIGVERGQFPGAVNNESKWISERLTKHKLPHSEALQQMPDGIWLKVTERRTQSGLSVGMRIDISEVVEAQKMAEDALQVKSEFISVLSHELRTPLTVILGYAKVLSNIEKLKSTKALLESDEISVDDFDDFLLEIQGQGDKISKSGEHLLVLINDLLDYSKIEAGHLELKTSETSLGNLIADVVDGMSEMAANKGIMLEQKSRDITIEVDPIRAKQVLINLVGNAIKFTDSGRVSVYNEILPGLVRITVEDTGCGIQNAELENVFNAFQQADHSDIRKAGGTGLGLAISRQIMLLHGGTIWATSTLGEGSKFIVEFPIAHTPPNEKTIRRISRLSHAAPIYAEAG